MPSKISFVVSMERAFDRDRAVLADLVHALGDDLADLGVAVRGDGRNLLDLLVSLTGLTAFLVKRAGGTAVFAGTLMEEAAVLACSKLTTISFLWWNLIGCLLTIAVAAALAGVFPRAAAPDASMEHGDPRGANPS